MEAESHICAAYVHTCEACGFNPVTKSVENRKRTHEKISQVGLRQILEVPDVHGIGQIKFYELPSKYLNIFTGRMEDIGSTPPAPVTLPGGREMKNLSHAQLMRKLIHAISRVVFFCKLSVFPELPGKTPIKENSRTGKTRDEYERLWWGPKGIGHEIVGNLKTNILAPYGLQKLVQWVTLPPANSSEHDLRAAWPGVFDIHSSKHNLRVVWLGIFDIHSSKHNLRVV
ncbi:hypothetical protein V8E51_016179 [Hyaloscypha variabilis]